MKIPTPKKKKEYIAEAGPHNLPLSRQQSGFIIHTYTSSINISLFSQKKLIFIERAPHQFFGLLVLNSNHILVLFIYLFIKKQRS